MDPRNPTHTTKHQAVTEQDKARLHRECDRCIATGGVAGAIATDIKRVSLGLDDLMQDVRAFLRRAA
jgi:hypothetical protein